MKKLLVFMIILLVGCAPDENTADDIQTWYDACAAIESCQAKVTELKESELSNSQIIAEIQATIADHEARLLSLESRVADLEYRVDKLENFLQLETIQPYIDDKGLAGVINIVALPGDAYNIDINVEGLLAVSEQRGYIASELRTELLNLIVANLSDVIEPEKIFIN